MPVGDACVGDWAWAGVKKAHSNASSTKVKKRAGRNQNRIIYVENSRRTVKTIIIENMERRIFHGSIKPVDMAQALLAEFNQGNLRAQTLGQSEKMIVQIGTHPGASSGGQTALTVTIQSVEDGIMIELGQQAWLGVAASLGMSALAALRNPFTLLGRLDDIAQDIENLQLSERIWQVMDRAARAAGASRDLSDRLKRMECEFCGTANPVGEPSCISCGAPLGGIHPVTCQKCGYVVSVNEKQCPNCGSSL